MATPAVAHARWAVPKASCQQKIRQAGQAGGQLRVVLLLAGFKANVLQQQDLPGLALRHGLFHLLAYHLVQLAHRPAQELGQVLGHGIKAQLRHHLPLGTPQVGNQDDAGAPLQEILYGGQNAPDPGIILHHSIRQGHIQIGPHQNSLPSNFYLLDADFGHNLHPVLQIIVAY